MRIPARVICDRCRSEDNVGLVTLCVNYNQSNHSICDERDLCRRCQEETVKSWWLGAWKSPFEEKKG